MNTKQLCIPANLTRAATLEITGEGEARQFHMSISSDEPYLRYDRKTGEDYYEVLDHSPGGFDDSRLKAGLPILFNHDTDQPLGNAKSYESDGKKLRASNIVWCNSDFAQSKKKDAESGALPFTSVGYRIKGDGTYIGERDGVPIYKFRFDVHEGSVVPVPADTTVGSMRKRADAAETETIYVNVENNIDENSEAPNNAQNRNKTMEKTPEQIASEQKILIDNAREDARRDLLNRQKAINDFMATMVQKHPAWSKVAAPIAVKHLSGDADFAAFRDAVYEVHPGLQNADDASHLNLGMNQKEVRAFSFLRAIHGLGTGRGLQGLEKEASDAHGKLIGAECGPNSFFVPFDVQRGGAFSRGITPEQLQAMAFLNPQTRALFTNVYSGAGAFVGTELMGGSLIELLRNQMLTIQMGARSMSGMTGSNIAIPRQTGGATASWLAEDSTITATQQTVGQLNMTPHKLAAATAFTEQFAMQTSVDAENFVRQDLAAVTAIARDLAAIAGTGASGQPIGILNLGSGNLSTPVTLSAAQSMTYANAVKFELNVSLNNANRGKLGYMASPTVKNNAKLIAEISAANSTPVWKDDRVNGYPALATNQIPTATSVIFGNWDDLILVDFAQSNFFVDPYSLSLQGQIRVINRLYCDNGVRHGTSFAVAVG